MDELERVALDAYEAPEPSSDLADRVLARIQERRPHRWPIGAGIATGIAICAAIALFVVLRPKPYAGQVAADKRTTVRIGARAVAVLENGAELKFTVERNGNTQVVQAKGDVFYRVEPGGPFVVSTPAGQIKVLGTCFRVEVMPMNALRTAFAASQYRLITNRVPRSRAISSLSVV